MAFKRSRVRASLSSPRKNRGHMTSVFLGKNESFYGFRTQIESYLSIANIKPFTGYLHEKFEGMINDTIYQIATSRSTARKIRIN